MRQILLPFNVKASLTFDNFYHQNQSIINELRAKIRRGEILHIIGGPASGKTHLLQAICNDANSDGLSIAYVPMIKFVGLPLESLELNAQVTCVDNIDIICGRPEWEEKLFHLYNATTDKSNSLYLSSDDYKLNFNLPDLKSRLSRLQVLNLKPLNDTDLKKAISLHTRSRGLNLDDKALSYMTTHFSRNMRDMIDLLDRMEKEALVYKKRITINFLKRFLRA